MHRLTRQHDRVFRPNLPDKYAPAVTMQQCNSVLQLTSSLHDRLNNSLHDRLLHKTLARSARLAPVNSTDCLSTLSMRLLFKETAIMILCK